MPTSPISLKTAAANLRAYAEALDERGGQDYPVDWVLANFPSAHCRGTQALFTAMTGLPAYPRSPDFGLAADIDWVSVTPFLKRNDQHIVLSWLFLADFVEDGAWPNV
jgi:hypothetical protein